MMVKSENPDETRAHVIGTIIEQWDEITSQVEELYNVLNDRIVADQKFREKIISNNLEIQSDIGRSEDMSRLIHSEIGDISSEFEDLAVWESLQK